MEKMTITLYNGTTIEIKAYFQANVNKWGAFRNTYKVNVFGHIFEYTTQARKSQTPLTEDDFKNIIYCLVQDALAYDCSRDYNDFCAEFGYETSSKEAQRIHKACKRTYEVLAQHLTEEDMDFINHIFDIED